MELLVELIQRSDPANLSLLALVWWRLNRRLRRLEAAVAAASSSEG